MGVPSGPHPLHSPRGGYQVPPGGGPARRGSAGDDGGDRAGPHRASGPGGTGPSPDGGGARAAASPLSRSPSLSPSPSSSRPLLSPSLPVSHPPSGTAASDISFRTCWATPAPPLPITSRFRAHRPARPGSARTPGRCQARRPGAPRPVGAVRALSDRHGSRRDWAGQPARAGRAVLRPARNDPRAAYCTPFCTAFCTPLHCAPFCTALRTAFCTAFCPPSPYPPGWAGPGRVPRALAL